MTDKTDSEIALITKSHLESLLTAPELMLTMLGPQGFNTPALYAIVDNLKDTILRAITQVDRIGQAAPVEAS